MLSIGVFLLAQPLGGVSAHAVNSSFPTPFLPYGGARDFAYQALPHLKLLRCKGHYVRTRGEPGDEASVAQQCSFINACMYMYILSVFFIECARLWSYQF